MQEFFDTLTRWWTDYAVPFKIVIVILLALIVRWLLILLLRRTVHQVVTGVKRAQDVTQTVELTQSPLLAARMVQRTRTLGTIGRNFITWVIVFTAFFIILDLLGVHIATLIASAGFIAAGLAFGAQNVVKDLLNGLFIVFEDQLGIGDVITIGLVTGVVEAVGLRITQVRAQDGTLWFIRNGEILQLGNHSYGWTRAVMRVDVDSSHGMKEITDLLKDTSAKIVRTPELARKVLEMPEVLGIDSVHADHVTYLLTVKTRPGADEEVSRALRSAIAEKFAAEQIKIGPNLQ